MNDPLKIIEQARDERLKNADAKAAIDMLEILGEEIKDDLIFSYDYPNLLKNLGICYLEIGEIERARETLEEALEAAKVNLNEIEMAEIRVVMARLELQVATTKDALYYANKAWDFIDGKKGDRFTPTKATTSEILGEIYYENEDYTEAVEKFEYALEQAKKVNFTERELTAALNIVNHYIIRGRIRDARKLLGEYIEQAKEYKLIYANYQLSLAKILLEEGEAKEATKLALEVFKLAEKNGLLRLQAESSQLVGSTYAERSPEKADSYFKKAFDLYNKVGYNLPKKHPKEEDWFNTFDDIE
ncbi:MAG TPA: tetratricopeptide repeat protein [Candidatus Dojkabacteria bacterium]|nr:tetratricopeptide repeat protein [Candidatus Dojkabacteria bacterium]